MEEDKATSRLFGHLGRLSPTFQVSLLDRVGLLVSKHDPPSEILLWYKVGNNKVSREIDAILKFENVVLVVENKLFGSKLDSEQLVDEYRLAESEFRGQRVDMACITNDLRVPDEKADAEKQLGKNANWIKWTSWLNILDAVKQAKENAPNSYDRANLTDLADYLMSRGIVRHRGFLNKDDWMGHNRLTRNFLVLGKTVAKIAKSEGYNTVEWGDADDISDLPYQDLTVYKISKRGERGIWFGVGDFGEELEGKEREHEIQVMLAAYAELGKGQFDSLLNNGYERIEPPSYWETRKDGSPKYEVYAKYLPISAIKGNSYEEQEDRITSEIRKWLKEIGSP